MRSGRISHGTAPFEDSKLHHLISNTSSSIFYVVVYAQASLCGVKSSIKSKIAIPSPIPPARSEQGVSSDRQRDYGSLDEDKEVEYRTEVQCSLADDRHTDPVSMPGEVIFGGGDESDTL